MTRKWMQTEIKNDLDFEAVIVKYAQRCFDSKKVNTFLIKVLPMVIEKNKSKQKQAM